MVHSLNHYTKQPTSGGKPKQVVVLLHGYGSNGRDLMSLAPYWQERATDALFVSPDAPFPCEMAPEMPEMRQWFSLAEPTPEKYLTGAQQAQPLLDAYLDSILTQYSLGNEQMALVGFSQGTMMSLYAGLRRKNKIAGILGYSGALIGAETLTGHNQTPIHLIHGEADSVVPIASYHNAVKSLKEKGFSVSGYAAPDLEHSIDQDGIESGARFIDEIFN